MKRIAGVDPELRVGGQLACHDLPAGFDGSSDDLWHGFYMRGAAVRREDVLRCHMAALRMRLNSMAGPISLHFFSALSMKSIASPRNRSRSSPVMSRSNLPSERWSCM